MNHDLTDCFRLALKHASSWTPDHVNTAVHVLLDRMASVTDNWDAASGEDWVQFMMDGDTAIYLRVNFPLAITLENCVEMLEDMGVVIVAVDDFYETRYRMDAGVMKLVLAHRSASGGLLDPNGFTIQELWRASI
jgi:hypothetical protein